jgi:transposase-like protein
MPKEGRHHCKLCNTTYSVTVGTFMHNTKVDLQKWFLCIALILNMPNTISCRILAKHLGVDKKTACQMQNRIRIGLVSEQALLNSIGEAVCLQIPRKQLTMAS